MTPQADIKLETVPEGHWVVLTSDHQRVVAHDPDLKKALSAAEQTGETDLVFMKNEAPGRFLVGSCPRF